MTQAQVQWDAVRAEFPAIENSVYLNTAGGAPLPAQVARAGMQFYEEMRDIGDIMWPLWLERVEASRATTASFLGVAPSTIAFTPDSSTAMNHALGYLMGAGVTEVLASADSFPSISAPTIARGVTLREFDSATDGTVTVADYERALTPKTGAVLVSAVEYGSAFAHDLRALRAFCDEHRLALVVDASQALGAMRLDVTDFAPDFLMASTYKWALGGYGLSVFYIAEKWHSATPPSAGWMSVAEGHGADVSYKRSASVVELGCPNFPAVFATGAGLRFLLDIGLNNIADRVRTLTDYLVDALTRDDFALASSADAERRAGIVSVVVEEPAATAEALQQRGIFVSAKGPGLRVSVYIYNTTEDIDRFVSALTALRT